MEKGAEVDPQEAGKNKIMDALNVLSEETGMSITQENGQRCLGPPKNWEGPPPPKGCEVFVGKLPRDVYEPDLVPLFSKIGRLYEMRLMMDFSGTNRGYCFVQYTTREDAQKAIRGLNDYEIRKGRKIGVLKSVDNCRLFIGGLPKHKTEQEIFEEINRVTEGVRKVIAYPSAQDKTKNRGFAFVEYNCHKTAAMARRKMIPGKTLMWGQEVCVDWAEPEPEVDPAIMNKVQNLYVRNLMLSTTEETLSLLFNKHSNDGVEKVKKIKDYAFIHFTSRDKAEAAKLALDKTEIDGSQIEINWAKPVEKGNNVKARGTKQRSRDVRSSTSTSSPEARSRLSPREQPAYSPSNSILGSQIPQYSGFSPTVMVPSSEQLSHPYMVYNYVPSVVPFTGFSPKHQTTSTGSVQELAQVCHFHRYGEPIYAPVPIREGNTLYYGCMVQLPQHPLGYRAYKTEQYFASLEDAKYAAAEGMLRILYNDLTILSTLPVSFVMPNGMTPTPYAN